MQGSALQTEQPPSPIPTPTPDPTPLNPTSNSTTPTPVIPIIQPIPNNANDAAKAMADRKIMHVIIVASAIIVVLIIVIGCLCVAN